MNREFKIRNVLCRNRIAIPPMVCFGWTNNDGYVTDRNVEHYKALAEGGAGLVIVEATAVCARGRLHPSELGLWEDGQTEGFRRITEAIHAGGAPAFIQLVHAGGNGVDHEAADAPSDMSYVFGNRGREMSKERIELVKSEFAAAAVRAKDAGFDGVEIHGCHGYLVSCFFNSRKNLRTDEYGRDKSLFAKEVLTAVREACGKDFCVGIRLGAFEPTLEDAICHAKDIAAYTDFLDVAYGGDSDPYKPDDFPCSPAIYGAMLIKKELPDMPVFGVHLINSREDAERALATGIDMVDVGKASLVDYSFANHVLNNEPAGSCLQCKGFCKWNPGSSENPDVKCPGKMKFVSANH